MTKSEFVTAMAQHGAMSKAEAERVFQAFRQTLERALPTAGKIVFPGFCTFEVVEKPARKGRNPATGQEIDIPAKKTIKIKAGKEFTDTVNS
ncbi:HU family DNA-binding protein [Acidithiobacillus sulfurivorans]|uniref:HU family DNA-binding protein n=1 Tax=Acidithiobacillus sulfurivorans TaxID=1958756 RepID=A0ABS5ZYK5_9PROT|nr:HU family DNA-binding protein [Acidithiobacillus sulfurivorans]MBU2759723.1 HU family DNA-binding protein [Acidithiobacillus sulfurivorans]